MTRRTTEEKQVNKKRSK